MRYQISDPNSMKRMIAVAIQEGCHCFHDWHDESYATSMHASMLGEIRDRDIEAELVDARAWIDNRAKAYEGRIDSIPANRIEAEDERPSLP